jgi:DNA-binding NtrC family response regulator/tetratricopeptide (TPR) repeat protein
MSANAGSHKSLAQRPLPGLIFHQAVQTFAKEDYESSLALVREGMDLLETEPRIGHVTPPDPEAARVCDAVVLWARNLFHLDRYDEFLVLLASAGRWGLVPEHLSELDLVRLSFAFKRGEYLEVVKETTAFVDSHRQELPPILADFLLLRGHCFSNMGDPVRALEDAEMAYSLFRLLAKDLDSARAANLQGMLMVRSSDFPGAESWFRRSYDLHRKLDMRKNMGGNRLNLGIVSYKRGNFAQAEVEFQSSISLLKEVDAQVPLCRAFIARGCNLRLQRDFQGARTVLNKAFSWANELMLAREEALSLEFLGDVCRDEGKLEQARRFYSRALAIGSSMAPDGDIVMEVMCRQGQCLSLLGRHSEGIAVLGRALVMARRLGDRHEEGVVRRAMASALYEMGDLIPAGQHIEQSVKLFAEVGSGFELAKTILVHSGIRLARLDGGLVSDPGQLLEEAWHDTLGSLDPFIRSGVDHWIVKARTLLADISRRRTQWEKMSLAGTDSGRSASALKPKSAPPIIHVSARMRDLIQLSDAFADSEEPVLITGSTGTGKELFARRLHDHSRRRSGELVCVNVTAIPESIFAREFFGHVQGSFSGADRDSIGLAAKADGGTLFLDEIGELPLELQPRLLRLLQDGTYHAIGDPQERQVDIRLVAATNADLEKLVAQGKFRADLYYRLKILSLSLPLIRERQEDILPLLRYFLSGDSGRPAEPTEYFNLESLGLMQQYGWPGNVREIAMVARQARVQMASTGQVCVEVGSLEGESLFFTGPQQVSSSNNQLMASGDGLSRSRILIAMTEANGNRAETARRLGVSRSTLYRHLEKMGVSTKASAG